MTTWRNFSPLAIVAVVLCADPYAVYRTEATEKEPISRAPLVEQMDASLSFSGGYVVAGDRIELSTP
jgi:hypothetical protein